MSLSLYIYIHMFIYISLSLSLYIYIRVSVYIQHDVILLKYKATRIFGHVLRGLDTIFTFCTHYRTQAYYSSHGCSCVISQPV